MTDDDGIHIEVVYRRPMDRVWRALTTSETLATWLMSNDFMPQVGHRFTFRTNPQEGWADNVACGVPNLDPHCRVAYTWSGGPERQPTLVSFTLEPLLTVSSCASTIPAPPPLPPATSSPSAGTPSSCACSSRPILIK